MVPVALSACRQYELETVKEALKKTIEGIGGLEPYLEPGKKVLLKVNLILAKKPDRHATTHPVFAQALAEILTEYGMQVLIGDSPGGPFNKASLKVIYRSTGMQEMSERTGFPLNENTDAVEVSNPDGLLLKHLTMTAMLKDVDYVISVSKLKTHSMMMYTGASKNMFGTVPGTVKADYHVRMPKEEDFANALIDICEAAHPVLSFMDAVVGMEGNGPTAGTPRPIGCVLASPGSYALDLTAAGLIGLSVEDIPLLRMAVKRGLLDPESVQTTGADPKEFFVPDYKRPDHIQTDLLRLKLPPFLADPITKITKAKVRFDYTKCVGCGVCASNCPPKALHMENKADGKRRPAVDHKQCIRCFCCQELCPQEAVNVKESWVFKIVNKL